MAAELNGKLCLPFGILEENLFKSCGGKSEKDEFFNELTWKSAQSMTLRRVNEFEPSPALEFGKTERFSHQSNLAIWAAHTQNKHETSFSQRTSYVCNSYQLFHPHPTHKSNSLEGEWAAQCGRQSTLEYESSQAEMFWSSLSQYKKYPQLRHRQQDFNGTRAMLRLGGSTNRKVSGGTGVFLPRQVGNPSNSGRKPKITVRRAPSHPLPNREEICLPQEWTYEV